MDVLTLLSEARKAGLMVTADGGDRLVIRGPRRAEPLARRLGENKPAVMAALRFDLPDGWTVETWIKRLRYMATICIHPNRARELAAWADGLALAAGIEESEEQHGPHRTRS